MIRPLNPDEYDDLETLELETTDNFTLGVHDSTFMDHDEEIARLIWEHDRYRMLRANQVA
jgi:hypothetical protein